MRINASMTYTSIKDNRERPIALRTAISFFYLIMFAAIEDVSEKKQSIITRMPTPENIRLIRFLFDSSSFKTFLEDQIVN